ncbi:hypothetical protein phiP47_054 [Plesiomonas phage phiP4-7]|nr:hypothetical protein phiP47_054 [Plesiomonas phage phiP4-7]
MKNELIKSLAKDMGVSEADVLCFARSIASSIEKDGASAFFVNADDQAKFDMVNAYASHTVRKINEFYTSYITNIEVNSLFNDMVYAVATGMEIKK